MNEDISVTRFREYLRIKTVHPDPDYGSAVQFLERLAIEIGLLFKVVQVAPKRPIVVLTWLGQNEQLPSIMLNSHMDVVPVFAEHWKYDPFSAHKDESGNIYARGTQDMKCVGIQYVEAVRRLKAQNFRLVRNLHIIFVPDEELGSALGMQLFVDSDAFKSLNIGFGLDEATSKLFSVVYQIFSTNLIKQKIINKFLMFREENLLKLKNNKLLDTGDVFTVNLTIISGGVQVNVIPAEFIAGKQFFQTKAMFEKMVEEVSADCKFEWIQFYDSSAVTPVDDTNPWWTSFSDTMNSMNLEFEVKTFVGGTDGRFLRSLKIPCIGFSPINHTPTLLHEHNEFLNEKIFLRGIEIYVKLIRALANRK
uniref:N-acyl-L-amino-acid amidohydrolase n=1 Tax=Romanomermis culicivorax TaxID=13658 RepID=A0A915LA52_ROMCU